MASETTKVANNSIITNNTLKSKNNDGNDHLSISTIEDFLNSADLKDVLTNTKTKMPFMTQDGNNLVCKYEFKDKKYNQKFNVKNYKNETECKLYIIRDF